MANYGKNNTVQKKKVMHFTYLFILSGVVFSSHSVLTCIKQVVERQTTTQNEGHREGRL